MDTVQVVQDARVASQLGTQQEKTHGDFYGRFATHDGPGLTPAGFSARARLDRNRVPTPRFSLCLSKVLWVFEAGYSIEILRNSYTVLSPSRNKRGVS